MPEINSVQTYPNDVIREKQRSELGAATDVVGGRGKTGSTPNYVLPGVPFSATSTRTLLAGRIYYGGFLVESTTPVAQLVCEVTTAGAAATVMRMALYEADANWQPINRIVDGGTVAVDSLGVKPVNVTLTLKPGRYLTALISDGGPTLRSLRGAPPGMALGSALGASPFVNQYYALSSGTALPSSGLPWTVASASTTPLDQMIVLNTDAAAPVIPGVGSPFTAMLGTGIIESLVVGNDYNLLLRGFETALEANRVWTWGPYWSEEGGTIKDSIAYADLDPRTVAQKLRAVIYADDGLSTKFDLGSTAISRPVAPVATGSEVTIAASAAPGRYSLPISHTFAVDTFFWIGVWAGPATLGSEVQIASHDSGFGHHRYRSTTGTAPYATTGSPPTLTGSNSTLTSRVDVGMHFVIKPTATTAPTLSLTVNSDVTITLTIGRTDTRTREYQIERSSDSGSTWVNLGVIACTAVSHTFRDPDLSSASTYQYKVSARYRSATAGSVTASATAAGTRVAYETFSPLALSTTVTVNNPLRGILDYYDAGLWPTGSVTYELFARRWAWSDMQPTNSSSYDYSYGDDAITAAVAAGRRVWLRWRSYAESGAGTSAPAWLTTAGLTTNGVPNWGSTTVVNHMVNVHTALGARYNNNNAVAAYDVGGIYRYGEWAGDGNAGSVLTVAQAKTLIAAACTAFSNKIVVVNLPDIELDQAIRESLALYSNLHVRQDGFGGNFNGTSEDVYWTKLTGGKRCEATRAMLRYSGVPNGLTRAVGKFAEPFGNGTAMPDPTAFYMMREAVQTLHMSAVADTNFDPFDTWGALGQQALRDMGRLCGYRYRVAKTAYPATIANSVALSFYSWWLNNGSAPCLEAWKPHWQLRTGTTLIQGVSSSLFLRDVPQTDGSPRMHQDTITFTGVTAGTYKLCIQVPQLNTSMPHMRLAHSAETSGQYTELGDVDVV